jgi:HlyD family secretion protein
VVVATGTLEALNTVIVGSQLSGQIDALHADFNQPVRQGDLLARIDPRTFEARVQQARADVAVAAATLAQREAELASARVTLAQAERELNRRQALRDRGHVSQSELDADLTRVETGRAGIDIAAAAVANAEALLAQRRSALAQAELDLERTEIRAPITGTVVNRTIQRGQTVAASLQAPELFQIAEDLHRMKVEASVDEADIGLVAEGMPCRFTVDAFPDRGFVGTVSQVRIAPDRLLNVVTYRVIITTANDDLALLPGMTANVEIVLGARDDVLRVPNAALRYEPREGRQGADAADAADGRAASAEARVWVLQGGEPAPRPVRTGLAGDLMTEILEGLAEGDEVIVGASRPQPR